EDIERLRFNVCVAHIYEFANAFQASLAGLETEPMADYRWAVREAADILVRLFHPMMPHLAEECWAALGHKTLVASEPWPQLEADLLVENTITLPVQIKGKKRGDVTVARNAANAEIETAVLAHDAVKRALDGRPPKKVIVVPQRIVNVVAEQAHGSVRVLRPSGCGTAGSRACAGRLGAWKSLGAWKNNASRRCAGDRRARRRLLPAALWRAVPDRRAGLAPPAQRRRRPPDRGPPR